MNKVVAFDLDGTLSQSDLFLLPVYRETLRKVGITPAPDDQLKNMIGGTAEDNWKIAMPERSMDEFREWGTMVRLRAVESAKQYGRSYPGIPESLRLLRERGYKIVLCSNGAQSYVEGVLDALALSEWIDDICPALAGMNKSELLARIIRRFAPAEIVMVGDRHFDLTAARDNRVAFIGCAYGLYPDEIADADCVIHRADELPDAVLRLLGEAAQHGE